MHDVTPFNFNGKEVRVFQDKSNNPWWIAQDVCGVLGLSNPTESLKPLDDDEKGTLRISEGGPERNIINESGLYTLILRSNKPQAKSFRKWVTSEVLPTIRKTGSYTTIKPATLLPVDREFRAAVRMAKAMGLDKNQAILSANRLTQEMTGHSPMGLLRITHLESDESDQHLTASDIGKQMDGCSAQVINKRLSDLGFHESYRDSKNRLKWRLLPPGKPFAVIKDTGKKNSEGTPVLQIFWKESVLAALQAA